MEFIPLFGDRKSGKVPIEYDHPLLEPVLKETYGVMVYQEQVMQAAQVLAGYTLGGADLLRRAMGKKKPEEMAKQRAIFVKGAAEKNKIPAAQANKLFDVLDKFAGYGFNKAHAACYGYLSYITAWLKANYSVQFMTSLLSNDMDNTDKIALFILECKYLGLPVLPPCVNHSQVKFSVEGNGIRYGLAAIKNVGSAAVTLMIEARNAKGPFKSVADLCSRVESRGLNKKLVESLAKAGGFDCLGITRAQAASEVDASLAQASVQARDRASGQTSLLDMLGEDESETLTKASSNGGQLPEYPKAERLSYEKELLGLYFSGHPLDDYLPEIEALQVHKVIDLAAAPAETVTRLAGLITKVEVRVTQKDKKPWAKYLFEDQSGATEVIAFPDTYASLSRAYQAGEIIVVTGTVNKREEPVSLRAHALQSLEEAREKLYQGFVVDVPMAHWNSARWQQLRQTVAKHPGKLRLHLRCHKEGDTCIDLLAGDEFNLAFSPSLKADLQNDLGLKEYGLIASRDLPKPKPRPQWKNGNGFAKKR
jgi:DNA polymerase-3 subunit alpha